MKILRHDRFGPPTEVLRLIEEPEGPLAAYEIAVDIEAAPVHAGDIKNMAGVKLMFRNVEEGGDNLAVKLPQVPGIEGVGYVVAAGEKVTKYRVGDRVLLPWQCGSWRDRIHVHEDGAMPAPAGDAVQLSLMVNAFTAYFALEDLAPLKPGDWFVQNGANSNVGRILISLARQRGVRTVNVVRRPELVPELKAMGADVVVVDGPDLAKRVRAEVGKAELQIALDGVAGPATSRLAECLSDGGTIANLGTMTEAPCHVETWILLYKRVKLVGYYAGFNIAARSQSEQGRIIAELASGIAAGQLHTRIAATYSLDQYREAVTHAAREGADREGKVVFVMKR